MTQPELIPHLFRTEFRKITSVLCSRLGIEHLETAEDIASDTFLKAVETWPYAGVPENPAAWLYAVAKNQAKNHLERDKLFHSKITAALSEETASGEMTFDWSLENIRDSQLQMLFALCHPALSQEAQIGLSLRILCGFGIDEIANAFLTGKETINKRLFRAKQILRKENVSIAMPPLTDIDQRLGSVLTTLYLLFNEGYFSESSEDTLRTDLCLEAMHLTALLLENERTNKPEVNALLALMCFHSSRFDARKDKGGEMILYDDQDESLWNQGLISQGVSHLRRASHGNQLTKYHLEATIAYWHTVKQDTLEKWNSILQLYNELLFIEYSPVAALNRTFALSKVSGKELAIAAAEKMKMNDNPFYHLLLGELHSGLNNETAKIYFQNALDLTPRHSAKKVIQKKISGLK